MNTNGNFRNQLSSIIAGDDLNQSEMYQMMDTILSGTLTDAQIEQSTVAFGLMRLLRTSDAARNTSASIVSNTAQRP